MKITVLDCETTTYKKGNAFSRRNRLCLAGMYSFTETDNTGHSEALQIFDIEYSDKPYGSELQRLREGIESSDLLVGFNIKFDLNWIRRYVPDIKFPRIWDCQLCHFIDVAQTTPYPSLNEVAAYYSLGTKLDVVSTQYWDNGIDTPDVPLDVLTEYLTGDLTLTAEIFKRQYANPSQRKLKELHFADTLTLHDSEFNGLPVDLQGHKIQDAMDAGSEEIAILDTKIREFFKAKPDVNILSSEQMSILLFGGRMYRREQVPYIRALKAGPVERTKLGWVYDVYPPRTQSPKSHELAETKGVPDSELVEINKRRVQEGKKPIQRFFSVEEPILRGIRGPAQLVGVLKDYIRLKELVKVQTTYYDGLRKLNEEMDWESNILHPNYNQCVVVSGRLSSTKPNAQNLPPEVRALCNAQEGYKIIEADARQLEWVCVANLANDKVALDEIIKGEDQHEHNRGEFGLPDRLTAKIFVFRLIYGGSAYSFASDPDFNHISRKESFWQDVIDKFYAKYKGIARWHRELVNKVVKSGGRYTSPLGRKYSFDLQQGRNVPRTKILNYPVQGFAADIMAIVRKNIYQSLSKQDLLSEIKFIGTVHDSVLLLSPTERVGPLKEIIQGAFYEIKGEASRFGAELAVGVGVKVKAGECWETLQEI
jgi:DNA polymerase I-like protein with 3'-5' exonuclease and polymerase domains